MNSGKTIFAQLMDFLPVYEFRRCVGCYHGNYKIKSFSCWDQFLCMAFTQLTYRESLRDIEARLRSAQRKVYHTGIGGKVSRNTLAHRNRLHSIRRTDPYTDVIVNTKLFLDAWRLTFLLSSDGSERAIFHTEAAGDTLLLVNPMHGSTPLGAV